VRGVWIRPWTGWVVVTRKLSQAGLRRAFEQQGVGQFKFYCTLIVGRDKPVWCVEQRVKKSLVSLVRDSSRDGTLTHRILKQPDCIASPGFFN